MSESQNPDATQTSSNPFAGDADSRGTPPGAQRAGTWASASIQGAYGLVLLGALAHIVIYARHESRILDLSIIAPDAPARALYFSWVVTLAGCFGLVLAGLTRWIGRAQRPPFLLVSWSAILVLIQAGLAVVLLFDNRLYENLGLHLWSSVVVHAVDNPGAERELHHGSAVASAIALFAVGVAAFSASLVTMAWLSRRRPRAHRLLERATLRVLLGATGAALVATSILAYREDRRSLANYFEALPLYAETLGSPAEFLEPGEVRYPPPSAPQPDQIELAEHHDVVVILVESLRSDYFTPELMPEATAYASANACIVSGRHFAGGHTTEYGTFGLLSGLQGYHYEPFSMAMVAPYPLQVLAQSGYRIVGRSASSLIDWNHGAFMFQDFESYEEVLDQPADVADRQVTNELVSFVAETRSEPVFAFAFFNSTHHNYLYPPEFEIDTPVVSRDYDHFMGDDVLREQRDEIVNRYRNSVRYVDSLFGEIARAAHQAGREPVIVLTGDHGEEFWERGLLGHGAARFHNERTQVPLLFCAPGLKDAAPTLSAHLDIFPTIFESLGARVDGEPLSAAAWGDGTSLTGGGSDVVWIGGLDVPWDYATGALVTDALKVWVELCPAEDGALCLAPIHITAPDDDSRPRVSASEVQALIDGFVAGFERYVTIR